MASVVRFGYQNSILTGQLSAGSQALPLGGLQNQVGSPAMAWQTASGVVTSAAGAWIRGYTPASVQSFDCFGVFRTNLTSSAAIRARVFSDAYATVTWDSGTIAANVQPGCYQSIILTPGTTGQYWELDFEDVGNPDGYINIPLAYVGPLLTPLIGLGPGSVTSNVNSNTLSQTRYGAQYVNAFWTARQFLASMAMVFDIEMASFETLDSVARDGTNVLCIPDVTSPWLQREAVFGMCTSQGFGYTMAHKDARSWAGTFIERV